MGLDLEERGWEETSPGTILKVVRALLVGSTAGDIWLSLNPAFIGRQASFYLSLNNHFSPHSQSAK